MPGAVKQVVKVLEDGFARMAGTTKDVDAEAYGSRGGHTRSTIVLTLFPDQETQPFSPRDQLPVNWARPDLKLGNPSGSPF